MKTTNVRKGKQGLRLQKMRRAEEGPKQGYLEHGGWEEVGGMSLRLQVVKMSQSQQKSAFFPSEAGLWPAS